MSRAEKLWLNAYLPLVGFHLVFVVFTEISLVSSSLEIAESIAGALGAATASIVMGGLLSFGLRGFFRKRSNYEIWFATGAILYVIFLFGEILRYFG